MSELRQRVLTAVVLAALLLVVLFVLPSVVTTFLIVLVVTGGAWEWSAFLHPERRRLRLAYALRSRQPRSRRAWARTSPSPRR